MKAMKTGLLVVFALLAVSFTAGANPILVTFNNGGNYADGGVYVGLYQLTLGSGADAEVLFSPCLSYNLEVSGGEQWFANEVNLFDVPLGDLAALKRVVWLNMQFAPAYSPGGNTGTIAPIQHAIWDLGEQVSGRPATFSDSDTLGWLAAASANYAFISDGAYGEYSVLVPVGTDIGGMGSNVPAGTPQFYLERTDTPEPFTVVLIGGGLIVLGIKGRKRLDR